MPFDPGFSSSYLVAFLMGLFSSMHCVGMCGSIIGTLTLSLSPEIRNSKSRLLPMVLNYNLGRITSYTLAGTLAGAIELIIVMGVGEVHAHRVLQLFSSVIMASAGFYIAGWFPRFAYIEKIGVRFWRKIEPFGRKLIPVKKCHSGFFVWHGLGLVTLRFGLCSPPSGCECG